MPKFHSSILTHAFSLVFTCLVTFIFASFLLVSPIYAAPIPAGCNAGGCVVGAGRFDCNFSTGGTGQGSLAHYCCDTSTLCTTLKANPPTSATGTTIGTGSNGALKVNPECPGSTDTNPLIDTALGCLPATTSGFSSALLSFLAGVVGLIALVVMLIATVMIMTGGGNPEQVKKGKELFTAGITGLFFIIFSVTILRIIAGDIIQLPGFIN